MNSRNSNQRWRSNESAVGCSLVGESLVAADEPKEDVWKGVLRLQERKEIRWMKEEEQKFDFPFPRCQLDRQTLQGPAEIHPKEKICFLHQLLTKSGNRL